MEGAQKDLVQIPDTPVAGKSVLNGRLGVLGRGSQRAGDGARAKVSGLVHDELFHVRVGTGGVTDTDHHRFTDWQLGLDSQAVINVGTVHLGDDGIGAQLLFRELRLLSLADQGHTAPGGAVHNVLVHALPEEKEEPPDKKQKKQNADNGKKRGHAAGPVRRSRAFHGRAQKEHGNGRHGEGLGAHGGQAEHEAGEPCGQKGQKEEKRLQKKERFEGQRQPPPGHGAQGRASPALKKFAEGGTQKHARAGKEQQGRQKQFTGEKDGAGEEAEVGRGEGSGRALGKEKEDHARRQAEEQQ